MTMCLRVFSSHLFWTSSSLDVPAGVIQEEGHTGFLIYLPSAVRALIFIARRIQPFLSLVEPEVEFCVLRSTNDLIVLHYLLGVFFFFFNGKNPVYRESNSRPNVSDGFEVTSELPGQPAIHASVFYFWAPYSLLIWFSEGENST